MLDFFVSLLASELALKGTVAAFAFGLSLLAALKLRREWQRDLILRAYMELRDAVLEVHQVYVTEYAKGNEDGKLTPEERKHAKDMAIATAKANIGTKGLRRLLKIVGVDLDKWLGSKVESTVAALKAEGALTRPY